MLGHLDDQIVFFFPDGGVCDGQGGKYRRKVAGRKFDINNRTHDLCNFTYIFSHFFLLNKAVQLL